VNAPIARKVAVKYRLGVAASELEKTFPLASNETVLAEGSIRVRAGVMLSRLGDLHLTNQRLVIVSHYAFQPDRGFEFPRGSVTKVDRVGSWLTLFFATATGGEDVSIEEHFLLPWHWPSGGPKLRQVSR
jgi:hypothetical protein